VKRRIAIVTGTRAEYGLLRFLMERVRDDARLELQLVATGMHLSPDFGNTVTEIEGDGFVVAERVDMLLAGDDPMTIAKSTGKGTTGCADAFGRLRPDVVVLLGDRFEILAAASAALLMRIPIAHLHGGEISEGAIDDSMRHAITKMSALHFVAAAPYRKRVIQLGEAPERVFDVGAPAVDAIRRIAPVARDELSRDLGLPLRAPMFLVTYHPATLSDTDAVASVNALCRALDRFPDARVVVTKPNADASGRAIAAALDTWAATRADRVTVHTSVGQRRYVSALRLAHVVIGNSSSGLIEAPALRVPTVNVGPRQDGRLKAASIVDCGESEDEIVRAIEKARSPAHAEVTRTMTPPYGAATGDSRDVAGAIAEVLATVPLEGLSRKKFHDVDWKEPSRG